MSELTWSRVHPVTPAVKGWKVVLVVLVFAGQQMSAQVGGAREAREALELIGWLPVVGVLVLVVLVSVLYATLAWRMTRYAVDAEAVYLQTGVLFRQQRSARLDRIQAIDVVQPVLARILGLAELKIEVAGGGDSAVRLSFLKEDVAQGLRNELLARAAGIELGAHEGHDAPAAPEREVLAVAPERLVASLLRSGAAFAAAVAVAVVVVAVVMTREIGVAFGMFPVVLGTAGFLWQRFSGEFGFRAAQSPDGIRLRHGLLESRAQTLPPGRVQAVRLSQPLLWRGKDWWRVQVNVAGYGVSEQQTESVLLPVGDREEALTALWLVLPDLGAPDPRSLLDAALSGSGPEQGFVTSPRRARWLDPLAWRRNGYALTGRALLSRTGRLVRELVVVPHERTQSLGVVQGPLQRRLGLASFSLHSTPGPVSPQVPHLDAGVAGGLLAEQAARARTARAAAGPERWMTELAATSSGTAGSSAPATSSDAASSDAAGASGAPVTSGSSVASGPPAAVPAAGPPTSAPPSPGEPS